MPDNRVTDYMDALLDSDDDKPIQYVGVIIPGPGTAEIEVNKMSTAMLAAVSELAQRGQLLTQAVIRMSPAEFTQKLLDADLAALLEPILAIMAADQRLRAVVRLEAGQ